MTCAMCAGRGLVRIAYRSGEPFDIAICKCWQGHVFRAGGPELVRAHLGLSAETRVELWEEFEEEPPALAPVDLAKVGRKQQKRPRL